MRQLAPLALLIPLAAAPEWVPQIPSSSPRSVEVGAAPAEAVALTDAVAVAEAASLAEAVTIYRDEFGVPGSTGA